MGSKVLIIGAVALGPKTASRLRRLDADVEITMIDRDDLISYGGCGIPYFISGDVPDADILNSTVFHVRRDAEFFKAYKQCMVKTRTEAVSIDRRAKTVLVRNLADGSEETLEYDKLVLATGAAPFAPPLKGIDLPGVHVVANLHHAKAIQEAVSQGKVSSAVVVGGGAIGLEMAEGLTDLWGIETTVVEMMDNILPQALAPDMARMVENELEKNAVKVITGDRVLSINGDDMGVASVTTEKNGEIPCQMVIMSAGVRPNSALAAQAGLAVGRFGGVLVNRRLQTSDPDIYAGGDCVELPHAVSGETVHLPLGSLANRQGRVIATNLAGGHAEFPPGLGTFCIKVFSLGVSRSGLTEAQAKRAGFDPVSGMTVMHDHAHFYPDAKLVFMRLIADRATRRVLGVEAVGENGDAVKARVDAIAAVMSKGGDLADVSNLEIGYAPPFASAMDIVNAAANVVENVIEGRNRCIGMEEFMAWLKEGRGRVLDIRAPNQAEPYLKLWGDRWINIPQGEITSRLDEIPMDEPLIVFCNTGLRSFEIQRILCQNGRDCVINVEGGHSLLKLLDDCCTHPKEEDAADS